MQPAWGSSQPRSTEGRSMELHHVRSKSSAGSTDRDLLTRCLVPARLQLARISQACVEQDSSKTLELARLPGSAADIRQRGQNCRLWSCPEVPRALWPHVCAPLQGCVVFLHSSLLALFSTRARVAADFNVPFRPSLFLEFWKHSKVNTVNLPHWATRFLRPLPK